jgi:periplasmic copper chaperone A
MTKRLMILSAAALVFATSALAHSKKHGELTIQHPWVPEGGGTAAVVQMTIRNSGAKPDRLLAATSKAGSVSIRTVAGADTVDVPAGAVTKLAAGSAYIELDGLKSPLTAYDRIPITLTFAIAGAVEVEVMVEPDEK